MATALLIDENFLIKKTTLAVSVDIKMMLPYIESTQDAVFESILGTELYNRLMTGVSNRDLTNDEKELLSYIRPALAWNTAVDAIPFIAIQVRNVGVMRNTPDKSQPADIGAVKMLVASCRDKADNYIKSLQLYLCNNANKFSQYTSPDGPRYPENQDVDCDIYLDDFSDDEAKKDAARRFYK